MPKLPKLPRRRGKPPLSPQQAAAKPKPGSGWRPPDDKKSGRRLPALKPTPLVAAAIVVLVALVALIVVVLLLGTRSDDGNEVRNTLDRFAQASRDKDYQALCDDLLATSLVEKLRTQDQPCEVVMRIGLSDVQNPTLEVKKVELDGDKATAQIHTTAAGQPDADTKILLVHEDAGWRISSLPTEQQAPAATP